MISKLPRDWRLRRFGELVASSQYGTSAAAEGGSIPMLRMNSIREGRVLTNDVSFVELSSKVRSELLLRPGDLLFNRTNSYDLVGRSALFEGNGEFVFASYIVRFRLKDDCADPRFINYFFQTREAARLIQTLKTKGVSQSNINPTALQRDLFVPVPPLDVQRKIADILSDWDEGLQTIERLISAKERRFRALVQRLLSGDHRIPKYRSEKPWANRRFGELFAERVETARGDLPLLAITAADGVVRRDSLSKKDTSPHDKSAYLRISPGDIGYNTMRMWQGVSGLSALEGLISPAYTVLIPGVEMDGLFASYLLKASHVVHLLWRHSQGLVDDTLNLKYHHFAQVRTKVPSSVSEQRSIASILGAAESEFRLLRQKHDALASQKRGLMQLLLTGKKPIDA